MSFFRKFDKQNAFLVCSAAVGLLAPPTVSAFDRTTFAICDTLTLYMKDAQAGTMEHCIGPSTAGGTLQTMSMSVAKGANATSGMSLTERREYGSNGALVRAEQKLVSRIGTTKWLLEPDNTGIWSMRVTAGGVTRTQAVGHVVSGITTTLDIYESVAKQTARIGQVWKDTVFDLLSATHIASETRCVSVPNPKAPEGPWVFVSVDDVVKREERWELDNKGKTLVQEIPPLFTAGRKRAGADANISTRILDEAAMATLFSIDKTTPPDSAERVCVVLSDAISMHESVLGFYEENTKGYILKSPVMHCQNNPAEQRKNSSSEFLRSTITVQSDHPRIQRLADSISARDSDPCLLVKKFNSFVYRSLRKKNVATYSSAVETLEAGEGDCGEHAVLLAALLRAAGIPARVVYGLVHANVSNQRGFFYHAWVLAGIGGSWIGTDPSHDTFPIPNTYVPLLIDDTGQVGVHLAKLIGRISISYVPDK